MSGLLHSRTKFLTGTILSLVAIVFARTLFSKPAIAEASPPEKTSAHREYATFAAGCFWSMEAIFKQLKGVEKVLPGYSGGKVPNPSYEDVETGQTGHAESVNIAFDPTIITYSDLLKVLLTVRNPTTPNQQGPDVGPQYRFIVFTRNAEQRKTVDEAIKKTIQQRLWADPISVEILPYKKFYRAEDYHIDYYRLHPDQPYCQSVVAPEIAEFRAKFKSKLKK